MKRLFLFCIIMYFPCNWLLCINEYDCIEIGMIENGRRTGQCKYKKGFQSDDSPSEFAISNDNKIYVCDPVNNRINVYDKNLAFIREIPDKGDKRLSDSINIEIDVSGNIIDTIWVGRGGFSKYDLNGNLKYDSSNYNYKNIEDIFIIEDHILFCNNDWEPQIVDNDGYLLNEQKKEEYLTYLESKYKGEIKNNLGVKHKLDDYLTNNNVLLLGDRLLVRKFTRVIKYYNYLSMNIIERKLIDNVDINIDCLDCLWLLNFDKNENSYWYCFEDCMAKRVIIVFSKYGEILDCIYNKKMEYKTIKVSNDGDIYFMEQTKNGHYFYKIERVWGLDQEEQGE